MRATDISIVAHISEINDGILHVTFTYDGSEYQGAVIERSKFDWPKNMYIQSDSQKQSGATNPKRKKRSLAESGGSNSPSKRHTETDGAVAPHKGTSMVGGSATSAANKEDDCGIACFICDKTYRHRNGLKYHLRTVHGEKLPQSGDSHESLMDEEADSCAAAAADDDDDDDATAGESGEMVVSSSTSETPPSAQYPPDTLPKVEPTTMETALEEVRGFTATDNSIPIKSESDNTPRVPNQEVSGKVPGIQALTPGSSGCTEGSTKHSISTDNPKDAQLTKGSLPSSSRQPTPTTPTSLSSIGLAAEQSHSADHRDLVSKQQAYGERGVRDGISGPADCGKARLHVPMPHLGPIIIPGLPPRMYTPDPPGVEHLAHAGRNLCSGGQVHWASKAHQQSNWPGNPYGVVAMSAASAWTPPPASMDKLPPIATGSSGGNVSGGALVYSHFPAKPNQPSAQRCSSPTNRVMYIPNGRPPPVSIIPASAYSSSAGGDKGSGPIPLQERDVVRPMMSHFTLNDRKLVPSGNIRGRPRKKPDKDGPGEDHTQSPSELNNQTPMSQYLMSGAAAAKLTLQHDDMGGTLSAEAQYYAERRRQQHFQSPSDDGVQGPSKTPSGPSRGNEVGPSPPSSFDFRTKHMDGRLDSNSKNNLNVDLGHPFVPGMRMGPNHVMSLLGPEGSPMYHKPAFPMHPDQAYRTQVSWADKYTGPSSVGAMVGGADRSRSPPMRSPRTPINDTDPGRPPSDGYNDRRRGAFSSPSGSTMFPQVQDNLVVTHMDGRFVKTISRETSVPTSSPRS